MTLALIRPDDWNLPLFVHVLGAMALVGTLLAVSSALVVAWRRQREEGAVLERFAMKTLLVGVLPSWIVMRAGAQWVESAEDLTEEQEEAAWLGIGYMTGELGGLLILISLILGFVSLRRGARVPMRIIAVITTLLVAAYLIAVWAMSAKPGA